MTFDNLAATAPFPASISTPLELNTPSVLRFKKKLGLHRGNPRIFFETTDIQPFGFVPGAKYTMALMNSGCLMLAVDPQGKRAVCKKAKPPRVLSVIDINSQVLEGFREDKEVLVTVSRNLLCIEKMPKE